MTDPEPHARPADPAGPVPQAGPADPPARRRGRTLLVSTAVGLTALAGVGVCAATGRLDSALLFVGIPCLLGLLVGLVPTRGGPGSVFQVVTVVLLLASALLHEGAICVLLASPLVYGVAFAAYGLVRRAGRPDRRRPAAAHAVAPVLLLLLGLEGVVPGTRVLPDQRAAASAVVAPSCTDFEAALARGPRPDPADRGLLLEAAGYPTPTAASGEGLGVGRRWRLAVGGGEIVTEVTGRSARQVDFAVLDDATAPTRRWVRLRAATLRWEATPAGCRAEVDVAYSRRLDPGWYFGPVTSVFMDAGARTFLRGLA